MKQAEAATGYLTTSLLIGLSAAFGVFASVVTILALWPRLEALATQLI